MCRDEAKQKSFSKWKSPITPCKRRLRRDSYLFANFLLFPHFPPEKTRCGASKSRYTCHVLNVFALESVEGGVVLGSVWRVY